MELTRRSFFGGALALVAASTVPAKALASLGSIPEIYGDGIHDDWAGLQAAFDGKPFRVRGRGYYIVNKGGRVLLSGGRFKLSRQLDISSPSTITNCAFVNAAVSLETEGYHHFAITAGARRGET